MRRIRLVGLAAIACGLATASLAREAGYKPPHNGFGQPDIGGSWSTSTLTPQVRPALYGTRRVQSPAEIAILEGANAAKDAASRAKVDVSAAAGGASDNVGAYDRAWIDNGVGVMRVGGEPRTSLITTEDGQVPPAKGQSPHLLPPGAGGVDAGVQAAKQAAAFDQFAAQGSAEAGRFGSYDNPENRSAGERCIVGFGRNAGPPMFPNGFYNNDYNIVQSPDAVVIQVEMNHDVRVIRLNSEHRKDDSRPYFGDSIGHWDGDTLVVETTNIPQAQNFMGSWKHLKVTERFTRVGAQRLRYAFTVEDPDTWDKPWGGEYEFGPMPGIIYEYACHEGNYALPGMLGGARRQEKEAAAKAGGSPGGGR